MFIPIAPSSLDGSNRGRGSCSRPHERLTAPGRHRGLKPALADSETLNKVEWFSVSTGGEVSEPSEDTRYYAVPLGGKQTIFTFEMTFSLPRGRGVDCESGGCHTTVDVTLIWDEAFAVLDGHHEVVTPLSIGSWTCYAEPSDRWPNAETCFKRVTKIVDILGMTPQTMKLMCSASTAASSAFERFSLQGVAGELVQLSSAKFDFAAGSDDGLDGLRIDETTEIAKPEWEADVRETPATDGAYAEGTVSPAAFLANKKLKVKAKFWGSDQWESAVLSATSVLPDGAASPYGALGQQTVTFDEYGESDEVEFESANAHDKAAANDITLKWQVVSITVRPDAYHEQAYPLGVPGFNSRNTTHRIYTVLKTPVAPMTQPWAKVLELSAPMLAGLAANETDENRLREIADGIFYSKWTGYDTRFFTPHRGYLYDPGGSCSCGSTTQQNLNLTYVLTQLAAGGSEQVKLQCNDSSNFSSVLAASQGIAAAPTLIYDSRSTAEGFVPLAPTALYRRAGSIPPTDQQCWINEFNFHQVASLSYLYDTSARSATGSTSACTPGSNFYGFGNSQYLATVFPAQPLAYTTFTRPSVGVSSCTQ